MADKIYKSKIGGEVSPVVPTATEPTHAINKQQAEEIAAASGGFDFQSTADINEVDVNSVSAVHALEPLITPTFDGSGQTVHPSVIYIPEGLSGYKYWMAHTPYPYEDSTKEIPSILASNDRINWELPVGAPNPLIVPPTTGIYADCCLIRGLDSKLYLYFLGAAGLQVISSVDGIIWSNITVVDHQFPDPIFSPSIIIDDGKYVMYAVNQTTRSIQKVSSTSPTSGFVNLQSCAVENIPTGFQSWHLEVRKYFSQYHLFLNIDNASSNNEIYFGYSDDSLNFKLSLYPLLQPEPNIPWTIDRIYKSSFILLNSNKYACWYTAVNGSNEWRIGYTEVALYSNEIIETTNEIINKQSNVNPNGLFFTENSIYRGGNPLLNIDYGFALSDEDSPLPGGSLTVPVYTDYMPFDFYLRELFINVGKEVPTGGKIGVDLRKNGVSVFSTVPTIDAGEGSSATASIPQVISDPLFIKGDKIEVYITEIGNTNSGKGLKAKML